MTPLAPDYLTTLATQIGGISAFLGGFAATFLAMFLTLGHQSRANAIAIGASTVASVAFVIAVLASTMLIAALHPNAPAGAATSAGTGRVMLTLSFLTGILALLASLGASGWTRSRRTGWLTSGIAGLGAILALAMLTG